MAEGLWIKRLQVQTHVWRLIPDFSTLSSSFFFRFCLFVYGGKTKYAVFWWRWKRKPICIKNLIASKKLSHMKSPRIHLFIVCLCFRASSPRVPVWLVIHLDHCLWAMLQISWGCVQVREHTANLPVSTPAALLTIHTVPGTDLILFHSYQVQRLILSVCFSPDPHSQ